MKPRRWLLTVLAAFTLLIAGCTGTPAGKPKAGATRSSTSVAVPALTGMPDPGSCWNVAPDHLGLDDWFDDSPKVPCTRGHTTQTARAFTVPEPTVAMAKSVADSCWETSGKFLGVDLDHWVPWQALVFLPSKAQIAKGASWVRCDVGIPRPHPGHPAARGTPVPWQTRHSTRLRLCGGAPAGPRSRAPRSRGTSAQPIIATRRPAPSPGSWDSLGYPSRAQRERRGTRLCRRQLTAHQRSQGLTALAAWDPPSGLADGLLFGVCWAFRPDGGPLPPRR